MRQNNILQHRRHKRIRASLQKAANPPLKSSAQSELCAEHFVLGKNEKENAYGNAQSGEREGIAIVRGGSGRRRFHSWFSSGRSPCRRGRLARAGVHQRGRV